MRRLPDLPYAVSSMGVTSVGSKLYVLGGADYNSLKFCVFTDCAGKNPGLGRHLLVLDTADTASGWKPLPDLPGSPRWVHAFSRVGTKLYAIGGATSNGTVVDNWVFDTVALRWSRLPDLAVSSGNFQTNGAESFMDRFIILVGVSSPDIAGICIALLSLSEISSKVFVRAGLR